MNNDFKNIISGLNSETLAEALKKAQAFSKTPEGRKMVENIKNGGSVGGVNKDDLMKAFKENPELLKKLNDMMR